MSNRAVAHIDANYYYVSVKPYNIEYPDWRWYTLMNSKLSNVAGKAPGQVRTGSDIG